MKFHFVENIDKRNPSDIIVAPFWEGAKPAFDQNFLPKVFSTLLNTTDFKGKVGETVTLYVEGLKEPRVLVLGLGSYEDNSLESLRRAFAASLKAMQQLKISNANILFPTISKLSQDFCLKGVWEGLLLTNYVFNELKGHGAKDAPQMIGDLSFIGLDSKFQDQMTQFATVMEGVNFARDLVNRNADDVTPSKLAQIALDLEKQFSTIKVSAYDRKWLEKEKMGLILAVNRGAITDPFLIEMTYKGNPNSQETVVFVGKGVTYDTGGLSLKPTDSMLAMKCDMAGAGCVLATIRTAAQLGLKVNLTVLIPTVENAIDAKSYKLGDVYQSYSGKTVEINNTDAEGRLILADALSYAVKNLKPKYLVDLATLTGNVVLALGEQMAGFCANDEKLAALIEESSQNTSDYIWRLPLMNDYKEAFKSDIADLVNSGGRDAGMIKGALFLQEFVEGAKWAHLDIAGTAFWSKPKWYHTTKATGYGVQLLINFLQKCNG